MNNYESGATSHAVNDLILWTENTPELAQYRDDIFSIYRDAHPNTRFLMYGNLLKRAQWSYFQQFGLSESRHILPFGTESLAENMEGEFHPIQATEFCDLYESDFEIWKSENI